MLIPRPETAFIVEEVARRVRAARAAHMGPVRPLNVLDLCTGSGCIPLLLSRLLGDAVGSVIGVDISGDAVALARDNIAAVGDTRVRVIQADMLSPDFVARLAREAGGTPFDLITANPPYIPADEYAELPRSVRAYEDRGALLAGPVEGVGEGVAFYAHIARLASHVLAPAESVPQGMPRVAVEIGAEQGEAVSRLLLGNTHVVKDQYGLDRMVLSVL